MRSITSWKKFRQTVRASGNPLLAALSQFPDSILVTGCQRSGTTIISRIIAGAEGIRRYAYTKDDELDAALILSGQIKDLPRGRYCFQTTYMYDSHDEYAKCMTEQKMLWVLRNPYSVVYSMLHNWKRSALNELFMGCGIRRMNEPYRYRLQLYGIVGVPPLLRACLSYQSKLDELFWLRQALPESSLIVVDYDELVGDTHELLAAICQRLNIVYRHEYGMRLHDASRRKADQLSGYERELIDRICLPAYKHAQHALSIRSFAE